MAWIDDRIWCHPKLLKVSKPARWTLVAGIAYASGWSTKGRLEPGEQETIGSNPEIRSELVGAGLWDDAGDGAVVIHDWDEHNSKRDARRVADRERKRQERKADPDGWITRSGKWNKTRQEVFSRDHGVCLDCGATDENWHADHVPSRSVLRERGLDPFNIAFIETRCRSCHSRRHSLERHGQNGESTDRTNGQTFGPAHVEGSEGSDGSEVETKRRAKGIPKTSSSAHSESLTAQPFVGFLVDESVRLGVPLPARSKGQAAKLLAELVAAGASEEALRAGITRMIERGRPISALTEIVREVAVAPAAEPEVDYPLLPPVAYDWVEPR